MLPTPQKRKLRRPYC